MKLKEMSDAKAKVLLGHVLNMFDGIDINDTTTAERFILNNCSAEKHTYTEKPLELRCMEEGII